MSFKIRLPIHTAWTLSKTEENWGSRCLSVLENKHDMFVKHKNNTKYCLITKLRCKKLSSEFLLMLNKDENQF